MTTRPRDEEASQRRSAARVWALSALLAAAAAAVYGAAVAPVEPLPAPLQVPWPALLVAFAAVEVFVIHLHLRRQAHSFSLSEVPLLIGLVFAGPVALVATRVLGALFALVVHRRQRGVKLAFNASHLALETCLAVAIFRLVLAGASPVGWRGTAAAFIVAIVADLLAAVYVSLAIALYEGRFERSLWREAVTQGVAIAAINTSLALLAITVLWHAPANAWVLVVLAALAVVAYRTHSALSRGFERLEGLYTFTRDISLEGDEVGRACLRRCQELLRADSAELVLLTGERSVQHITVTSDPGDGEGDDGPAVLHGQWSQAALDGRPVLLARGKDGGGPKDGLAAPLLADGTVIGALIVTDRSDEVSTFEPEDLRLLETLANHTTVALRNSRLIERLRQEAIEKEHQALHDALTGLPNRRLFRREIDEALRSVGPGVVAVALMDLDRFKEINDTLGHQMGDHLLREVSGRLVERLAGRGVVARLGGDEFGIVLTEGSAERAVARARELLAALDRPIGVGEFSLRIGASLGLAIAPDHGRGALVLVQRADVAMYAAKRSSGGVALYDPENDQHSRRRLVLLHDLGRAIEGRELAVHYQPKARLRDGCISGVEALVRWPHPVHGLVPPTEFVPLAEHSGLIRQLTLVVLEDALRASAGWRRAGWRVPVAVNLSVQSLLDVSIIDDVQRLLARTSTSPADLTLEITETSAMADPRRTLEILHQVAALGVGLALDDFGTGYSSLSYLHQLPVHEVKIDKSFVQSMWGSRSDEAIVRSVIELGHNLGLSVTAEGVEDERTWQRLGELRCDVAQGYLLSRPVPAGELSRQWADASARGEARVPPATAASTALVAR